MTNKLAMFTGMYIFASITAGVYAYKKITGLKQQRDNQFNALELLSKNNEERWQHLFKEYEEQLDRIDKLEAEAKAAVKL